MHVNKNTMKNKVTPFFKNNNTMKNKVTRRHFTGLHLTPYELKNGAREARDQEKTLKNIFLEEKKSKIKNGA